MLGLDKLFWKGRKVLLTGHTGFKGGWLSLWLQSLQADVIGIALDHLHDKSLYEIARVGAGMTSLRQDIRDRESLARLFTRYEPEIVIHLAAQPLVRYSYRHPVETWETNVMGSINVLEAVRQVSSVRSVIMVTSDKCYLNREWEWGYRETDHLGGYDPYSSSKAATELLTAAWRNSFFQDDNAVAVASVRAGNVIGGGDWAEDRLLPDIVRAFSSGEELNIRYPDAVRPWQHILEPLHGYLMLAEKLYHQAGEGAQAWNFGPDVGDTRSVKWIVEKISSIWGTETNWRVDESKQPHEAGLLSLDCSRARKSLGWQPRWNLEQALERIVDWHQAEIAGKDMFDFSLQQIQDYINHV